MDVEIKEMFGIILGKLESMDEKVTQNSINLESLDKKLTQNSINLESMDKKVTQNSISLESMQSDMRIIVEVQKSQYEELNRKLNNISDDLKKEISLHSTVIKDLSLDVRKLEEGQKSLEKDVAILKKKIS
ncbi:MAG: hypothetical protein WA131_00255 [Desulfitobacteriaceae bacterium]